MLVVLIVIPTNTLHMHLLQPTPHATQYARRMGGGFGGKANRSQPTAAAAALAAHLTQRAVRLANTRNADMAMVGGRCETLVYYDVGFDAQGRLLGLDLLVYFQGGAFMVRALWWLWWLGWSAVCAGG